MPAEDGTGGGKVLKLSLRGRALFARADDITIGQDMAGGVLRALRAQGAESGAYELLDADDEALRDGMTDEARAAFHEFGLTGSFLKDGALQLIVDRPDGEVVWARAPYNAPDARSLVPPLVAILLAILLRKPVIALLAGVASGSVLVLVYGGKGFGSALLPGLVGVADTWVYGELVKADRLKTTAFVVFMLAMVGIIIRAGGIHGLMQSIARIARDARRTQIATWLMGLAVFFDDYANTILVGSTMRTLTDKFRIAREKLAYIVDSTAAPVAGISILSTWIAFEVSTFSAQLPDAGLSPGDGYAVFIQTLPYRFYCIFTLFFVGLVVCSGRDFGPMLRAERRARGGLLLREGAQPMVGKAATNLKPSEGVTPHAALALVPIGVFVLATLGYIFVQGGGLDLGPALFTIEGATSVLSNGSGFDSLMYGGLAGLVTAAVMATAIGLGAEVPKAAWACLRSMGVAIVILYMAWSIGEVCGALGTADYLSETLGSHMNPLILPVALFALSAFVAFSTGSSWSTMSILLPLVVGLAYTKGGEIDLGGHVMLVVSIGAVLEGAIWGDHCSPISDTTVMSSIASASDHVDHVRTQMPYAFTTMAAAMLFGYLPAVILGLSPWISIVLGCAALTAFLYWKGERADDPLEGKGPSGGDAAEPA